jgi:hypothetical protein
MAKEPIPIPEPDVVRPPTPSEVPPPDVVVDIPTPAPDVGTLTPAQHNAARVARRCSEGSAAWGLRNSSPTFSLGRASVRGGRGERFPRTGG